MEWILATLIMHKVVHIFEMLKNPEARNDKRNWEWCKADKKIEYIFRLVHWLFMHTSHTMLFVSVETKEEAQIIWLSTLFLGGTVQWSIKRSNENPKLLTNNVEL